MQIALLTAVRTTVRADTDPVRRTLFSTLRRTSTPVRVVCAVYDALPSRVASLLVSLYGLGSWLALAPERPGPARLLAVAGHANARRHVDAVAGLLGAAQVNQLRTGAAALRQPATLARVVMFLRHASTARRALRLVRRIDRRRDFLVSCRVASLVGCYIGARRLLVERRPAGVLVSSDSNPEEVGLVAAAEALGIATIFVSHAYTTPKSPRLKFTLSVLEGEAAVEAHARKGPIAGAIFLGGVEGPSHPMDTSRLERPTPVVGIFTPKVVSWPILTAIIDDCRQRFHARQIVIRWHPSMIERPKLGHVLSDTSGILETPRTDALLDVASRCDWVIADTGSNVHLEVLKLGIPTIAVGRMGLFTDGRADPYGFVAARVLFPTVASLGDLSIPEAVAFYGGDWATRFTRHDASYLHSERTIASDLVAAIENVLLESDRPARAPA